MRTLAVVLGLTVFLLNPWVACSSAEPDYQYGDEELRAAIEGTWLLDVRSTATPAALTLQLEQAAAPLTSTERGPSTLVRTAHACGTRTLVAAAAACIDSTEMPLQVSFVAGDSAFEAAPLSGRFWVDSLVFDIGTLELSLGDLRVTARVRTDGSVLSAGVDLANSSVSLERMQR